MKTRPALSVLLLLVIVFSWGCGNNKELRQDVAKIAESMCKITGVMYKLRDADPSDTTVLAALQMELKQSELDMSKLNIEFQEKYKSKLNDPDFRKEYSTEIRKAILKCPHLSKEDRERYEKEIQ